MSDRAKMDANVADLRLKAAQEVYKAACRNSVEEHLVVSFEDAFDQATYDSLSDPNSRAHDLTPLATDLVQFVMWLREDTDYFSGPDLDISFPKVSDPDFYEVLADNAIIYTGE